MVDQVRFNAMTLALLNGVSGTLDVLRMKMIVDKNQEYFRQSDLDEYLSVKNAKFLELASSEVNVGGNQSITELINHVPVGKDLRVGDEVLDALIDAKTRMSEYAVLREIARNKYGEQSQPFAKMQLKLAMQAVTMYNTAEIHLRNSGRLPEDVVNDAIERMDSEVAVEIDRAMGDIKAEGIEFAPDGEWGFAAIVSLEAQRSGLNKEQLEQVFKPVTMR